MPVYVNCPHCEHPQIVPMYRRGRMRFCRQCGRAFMTSKVVNDVHPVPIASLGELHAATEAARSPRGRRRVYVLD